MKKIFRLCLTLVIYFISISSTKKDSRTFPSKNMQLISINIIDRSGLSETICNQEKLKKFNNINFLSPQQYQKVLRTYKVKKGLTCAILTSYHPNGQVKQYLEIQNNRAFGQYYEWFSNGTQKIKAFIVGGLADLNASAETSWLFHGENFAYNSEGKIIAQINYKKGVLDGTSLYFHSNGTIWKKQFFKNNLPEGTFFTYLDDGSLLLQEDFSEGKKNGWSFRFWNKDQLSSKEFYVNGSLIEGEYFDITGNTINQISTGNGFKAIFGKIGIKEQQSFLNGVPEGEMIVFNENCHYIQRSFFLKQGLKEGEEKIFYPNGQIKASLHWHEGVLQGPIKTWYENGSLESQREINENQKEGPCSVWYPNGQIMLNEIYENNLLVKGEYYKLGNKHIYSKVEKGIGTASIFTESGILLKKILYQDGLPITD